MNKTLSLLGVVGASIFSTLSYGQTMEEINCKDVEISLDKFGFAEISPLDLLVEEQSQEVYAQYDFSVEKSEFSCDDLGLQTVRLTATDKDGETLTCDGRVMVDDLEFPTALCKDVTLEPSVNTTQVNKNTIDDGSFDNCNVTYNVTKTGTEEFKTENRETYIMTVTDSKGNTSFCTSVVVRQLDLNNEVHDILNNHVLDDLEVVRGSENLELSEYTELEPDDSARDYAPAFIHPKSMVIYPNPAEDHITFLSKDVEAEYTGKIMDASGEVLCSFRPFSSGQKLFFAELTSGSYVFEVMLNNMSVRKFRLLVK